MANKINITANIINLIFFVLIMGCNNTKPTVKPPNAEEIKKELTYHGHTRFDNYFWLRERENPKVIDYLKEENKYVDEVLSDTKVLQESLFSEITSRIKQTDMSAPFKERGYYYYVRFEEGKEYPVYCRKKGSLEAKEEVLLNANEMAEGYKYYKISGVYISPNNNMLGYGVDTVSRRKYTLYFKDLTTGKTLEHSISNTTGSLSWANDNNTVFYTRKDEETLRANKIFKHKIHTSPYADQLVFFEENETFSTGVFKTKSDGYIMIVSYATTSTEFRCLDADNPEGEFKIFHPREKGLEYSVDHFEDKFYVVTNLAAKNFRLMQTSINQTEKEHWKELIPHRDNVYLSDIEIFKNYLVVNERKEGLNNLRIIDWNTQNEHYLDFGEDVYDAGISINPEFDSDILRYSYTSLTTPNSTYDYNMKTQEKTLLKQQEVLGDFNSENYEAKRLYATSHDGEQVPISIVYRKDIDVHAENPMFIKGYGSYGITIDPYFSSVRLSLLNRGFIFAIAHVRGGQIKGRSWYEDGKLLKKKNSFYDFIACCEYLVNEKYTSPEKLFAQGGSAGGLLMGAVVNMRPELFKGILASVPFVDVLTTMLDESIPLTTGEYDEWGNPNEKEFYDYILSYSPYDNVSTQNYPNMLIITGLHDSQVQYWEPAKWVAKLRDLKTDDNYLLLYTNMDTGHGGASGRFERHKETAMEYAFIFKLLGITE